MEQRVESKNRKLKKIDWRRQKDWRGREEQYKVRVYIKEEYIDIDWKTAKGRVYWYWLKDSQVTISNNKRLKELAKNKQTNKKLSKTKSMTKWMKR